MTSQWVEIPPSDTQPWCFRPSYNKYVQDQHQSWSGNFIFNGYWLIDIKHQLAVCWCTIMCLIFKVIIGLMSSFSSPTAKDDGTFCLGREHQNISCRFTVHYGIHWVCGWRCPGHWPDREPPQVREQLWEESDQVRGGGPGLQVQVFQVWSSVWDHMEVFRLQINT